MKLKSYLLLFFFIVASLTLVSFAIKNNRFKSILNSTFHRTPSINYQDRLNKNGIRLKAFMSNHLSYNQQLCFMVDMRMPSNLNRFFVYDMKSDSILKRGIVAHGIGSNTNKSDSLFFKNEVNSKCTSLGKYKIGKAYDGRFGKSYKLHGLDASNNKAFERFVVLHSYWEVPYQETFFPIINSEGCVMLAPKFLNELEPIIDRSAKPILLYVYY